MKKNVNMVKRRHFEQYAGYTVANSGWAWIFRIVGIKKWRRHKQFKKISISPVHGNTVYAVNTEVSVCLIALSYLSLSV